LWASGGSPGVSRPTWLGELSCAEVCRQAGLPAMGLGRGRREKVKGEELKRRKQKQQGPG
jgi:hypothetical protein